MKQKVEIIAALTVDRNPVLMHHGSLQYGR
jgi:hypothetical protein